MVRSQVTVRQTLAGFDTKCERSMADYEGNKMVRLVKGSRLRNISSLHRNLVQA